MKVLGLLLLLAAVSAQESHNLKKRSPDDDIYFFQPATRAFGGVRTFTQSRSRYAPRRVVNPYRRGYFYDFDDLFDDRRKRQIKPSDATLSRNKRSPDDDIYFFQPARTFGGVRTFAQSRSRFVPRVVNPYRRGYFYDFDDLFDDRRKRQIKPTDAAKSRSKRSPDDEIYFFQPARTFGGVRTFTQSRSRFAPRVVNPYRRGFFYDFDDLFDDRRKRQVKPSDAAHSRNKRSPDDIYYFQPARFFDGVRTFTQSRSRFTPKVVNPYRSGYFYDFDDLFDDRRKRQIKPSDTVHQ